MLRKISIKAISFFDGMSDGARSISIILLGFIIFFAPLAMFGKTLYPGSQGRSIQFFNDNPSLKTSIHRPVYLDNGATDWIEAPFNKTSQTAILQGDLPLWNPYSSLGMPVLGNLNGATVAPLSFFLNFINSEAAWNLMYVGRLFFAVLFSFYFIRKLGLNQIASISGALLFGFSGYSQLHLNMFHFNVDAMLPFLFWATLSFIRDRSRLSWILLVAAIIGSILGGNPQNLILSFLSSIAFFVCLSKPITILREYKYWALYFLAFIVGVGCCAFYELSFYELYSLALKYHDGVGKDSLPVIALLGLIFPVFLTAPALAVSAPFYLPYFGFFSIPVIVAGLNLRGLYWRETWFFLGLSLFFICKVVGFALLNWIGELPVLNEIGFTKYLSPLYFSLSVLFSLSVNDLWKKNNQIRFAVTTFILFVFFVLLLRNISLVKHNEQFVVYWVLLLMCLISTVTIVLKVHSRAFIPTVVICLFVELFFNQNFYIREKLNSGVIFNTPKFVQFIEKNRANEYDRVFGVGRILMGNQSGLYGIHDIRGLSATTDNRYYVFMRDLVLKGNLNIHPFITASTIYQPESRPFLNLLGVNYLLFEDCKAHQIESATLVYQDTCLEVHKNNSAFNRSFVVHDYQVVNDNEILPIMGSGKIDFSRTALLNSPIATDFKKTANVANEVPLIESYSSNNVSISVVMNSSGILVLSDLSFPGWVVYVDGKKKDLLTVNYILRGVVLDAGPHEIEFSYEPFMLKLGFIVSIIFLSLTLLIFFLFPKKVVSSMLSYKLGEK